MLFHGLSAEGWRCWHADTRRSLFYTYIFLNPLWVNVSQLDNLENFYQLDSSIDYLRKPINRGVATTISDGIFSSEGALYVIFFSGFSLGARPSWLCAPAAVPTFWNLKKNIARIANAVQCHIWWPDNKVCHEFRCSIVVKTFPRKLS